MTTNVRYLSRPRAVLFAISSHRFAASIFAQIPRLLKFGTVGCSGIVVNSVSLLILHEVASLTLLFATPVAVEIAIVNNFAWNNIWTFGRRRASVVHAFCKYNISCLLGLVICMITVQLLVNATGLHYLIANLAGICLAATFNFLLSNRWAWREQSEEPTASAYYA